MLKLQLIIGWLFKLKSLNTRNEYIVICHRNKQMKCTAHNLAAILEFYKHNRKFLVVWLTVVRTNVEFDERASERILWNKSFGLSQKLSQFTNSHKFERQWNHLSKCNDLFLFTTFRHENSAGKNDAYLNKYIHKI